MLQNHASAAAALEPEDLQMLQRVFDRICDRRGLIKNTARASAVAADLIDMFQHGIRNERQLLAMFSLNKDYP